MMMSDEKQYKAKRWRMCFKENDYPALDYEKTRAKLPVLLRT